MNDANDDLLTFTTVAEDRLGSKAVQNLVDRALTSKINWLSHDLLKHQRQWQAFADARPYDNWKHAVIDKNEHFPRPKFHGQFKGEAWASEALHYKCLFLLYDKLWQTQFLFIARDGDKDSDDRHEAFKFVYEDYKASNPERARTIILAFAIPEVEAWLIAGFECASDAEKKALKTIRQQIGFNPVGQPERLTSNRQTDKKDAKRIFGALCCDSAQTLIEDRCLNTDFETLKQNGQKCGLANFLKQLESKVLPLISKAQ